nr:immunoglobulin light chain junction region [Macaca mulatta]
CQQYNDWNNF